MNLDAIFKAYDIRGRIDNGEIDADVAHRIGAAFAAFSGAERIAVGRDIRTSSAELGGAFMEGVCSQGADVDDIGLIELNEAFASQALYCVQKLDLDPAKVNVNGGAIALGHPLGCTGAKLTATLLHEMKRREVEYGIVSMCIGGGMGMAMIVER